MPVRIKDYSSISGLGCSRAEVSLGYAQAQVAFAAREFAGAEKIVSCLSASQEETLQAYLEKHSEYRDLDRSVHLALYAAEGLLSNLQASSSDCSVFIGSSRGATGLFEKYHSEFLRQQRLSAFASPTTTSGNISSWIGRKFGLQGTHCDHSVTCSTGLHAVLHGIAWLKAGMARAVVAGGTEASLTGFTIAQMEALRIYSRLGMPYPCQPCAETPQGSTFVLGEGAALFFLDAVDERHLNPGDFYIAGFGTATEVYDSPSGISAEGLALERAMRQALQSQDKSTPVDAVILHAPGTKGGDAAELCAIRSVFGGEKLPALLSNKFLLGHTLAASGALSLEYALNIMQSGEYLQFPYATAFSQATKLDSSSFRKIMINSTGFGGNAVSLIVAQA